MRYTRTRTWRERGEGHNAAAKNLYSCERSARARARADDEGGKIRGLLARRQEQSVEAACQSPASTASVAGAEGRAYSLTLLRAILGAPARAARDSLGGESLRGSSNARNL